MQGERSDERDEAVDWRETLEALPDAVLVADDSGRYVFVNSAASSLLGREKSELVGRTIDEIAGPGSDFGSAWGAFEEQGRLEGEFDVQLPQGGRMTLRFHANRNFRPGLHISIVRDATDENRVEDRLRTSEAFFVRAFNSSPAPTNVRLLSTGVLVETNPAFSEATGYWRSDVLGRTAAHIGLWEDATRIQALLEQLRTGGSTAKTRAILVTKSGERREFSVALRKFELEGVEYAVACYSDIASL